MCSLAVDVRSERNTVELGVESWWSPFSIIPYPFSRQDSITLKEVIVFRIILCTGHSETIPNDTHRITVRGFMQTFLQE